MNDASDVTFIRFGSNFHSVRRNNIFSVVLEWDWIEMEWNDFKLKVLVTPINLLQSSRLLQAKEEGKEDALGIGSRSFAAQLAISSIGERASLVLR